VTATARPGLASGVAMRLESSVAAPEMTRRAPSMGVLRGPRGSFRDRALRPPAGVPFRPALMGLAIRPGCFDLPARPFGLSATSGRATARFLPTLQFLLLERVDSPLEAFQDLLKEVGLLPSSGEVREAHGPILGELAAFAAALSTLGVVVLVPQVSRASDPRPKIPGRQLHQPAPKAFSIERELVPGTQGLQSLRFRDHGGFSSGCCRSSTVCLLLPREWAASASFRPRGNRRCWSGFGTTPSLHRFDSLPDCANDSKRIKTSVSAASGVDQGIAGFRAPVQIHPCRPAADPGKAR